LDLDILEGNYFEVLFYELCDAILTYCNVILTYISMMYRKINYLWVRLVYWNTNGL